MNNSNDHSVTKSFPAEVFAITSPARLRQGSWMSDASFLDALYRSWLDQYADYIGRQQACEYVEELKQQGRLYDHHDPLTVHAWVDERIVGVTALRPLQGIDLITMLEVLPQYRGCEIGAQLLEALCSASGALMAHVSVHKPRVLRFYQRHGFHVLQRATVQHGVHALEFDVVARGA